MSMSRCLLVFIATFLISANALQPAPQAGRSYILFNNLENTNPYYYVAWTTDSSLAKDATSDHPGVYMAQGSAGVVPPHALWMFDYQSDETYRIYAVDNSYSGSAKRLDVRDEYTPFMGEVGSGLVGQVWELFSYGDGYQIYNHGWKKVLDVDPFSSSLVNQMFVNPSTGTDLPGQIWHMVDWTPTLSRTATSFTTRYSTVTPTPTIVYVGGDQVEVTSMSTIVSTITVVVTSTQQATVKKRDAMTIPAQLTITTTISTTVITTVIPTTLPAQTNLVTTGGGTNTVVQFSTSFFTTTVVSVISVAAPLISTVPGVGTTVLGTVTIVQTPTPSPSASDKGSSSSLANGSTGTPAGQTTVATTPTAPASAPAKSTTKVLSAGLGAGMGVLFILLLALGLFFFRRRQKKPITNEKLDPENRKSELPAEAKNPWVAETAARQESPLPPAPFEAGGREKHGLPARPEMEGEFGATVSPVDYMVPDASWAGYGRDGAHELPVRRY